MIELTNVSKKYNGRYVLKDVSLTFPRFGLVIINGPSGCGKTTLLNILSTLLSFSGDISFDGKSYQYLSDDEKEIIRSRKLGFLFQDYKLFEYETVKANIELALDISCGDKKSKKEKRIKDLLRLVGLSKKENQLVSNLSGGEKQRVGLARAIANSPLILLADEPTGNLDEHNSEIVMSLLEKISSSSLVIMVSHDIALSEKYADQIIKMCDGKVVDVIYQNKKKHQEYLPVLNLSHKTKTRLLPFPFLFKHTLHTIKRRKWRTMFITFVTSFGLIGVGLASTLSNIISSNLYRSYSSILDDDRLILSSKQKDISKDIISGTEYDEVISLAEDYKEDIDYIGVYYANDFKKMFDYNVTYIEKGSQIKPISGLDISSINEFGLISKSLDVYPNKLTTLANDEFILSCPFSVINEMCFQLQIERTTSSFSKYIEHNDLFITFLVSHSAWQYEGSFTLKLKGFCLSNQVLIYHSNPIWNEYILENKLTLPTTNYLNVNSEHPWDLKKSYYFSFKQNKDLFIKEHRFDFKYHNYDFEILTSEYYPILYNGYEPFDCPRLLVINRSRKDYLPSFIGSFCKEGNHHIKSVTYGCSNAYAIYDRSLMVGFSKSSYLSSSEVSIYDVVDLLSYVRYEDSQNISLPINTVEGHFSKSNISGFCFEPYYQLISGREPVNYQEIVISSALLEKLNITELKNKTIYFTFPVKESLLPNGYISRDFKTVPLKIVGVSNSAKLALHHDESWSILFFQCMLGISTFDLNVENFALQIDTAHENDVINFVNRAFPQYEIYSPLKDVKNSVDEICGYIELILLVVSISSVLIASLILFICNYLHFLEVKKDIGLVRCLGSKKSQSKKFIYFHSFIMTSFSLMLSVIELLIISFVLSKTLASSLHIQSMFVFNPMSVIYMILVDTFISIISSILISRKISKIPPLECLQ